MSKPNHGDLPPRIVTPVPGRISRRMAERLAILESRNVTFRSAESPIFWRKARGSNVWDPDGNRYVDLTAGFGVAALGHGDRRVAAAIRRQVTRQMHGLGDVHPPLEKLRLLDVLARHVPIRDPRIVLMNSGSEAVETALKTARLATGRPGVLAFEGAYHGLTYGALALTDRAHFRAPFSDQLNPHVVRAPFPLASTQEGLSAVEAALNAPGGEAVGAVVIEPIQGRAGILVPPAGFLSGLAALCRDRGSLLILDEIYTGFGRTGRWFACEEEAVVPDLLCLGKALSGSLPVSACVGSAAVMSAWPESAGEAIHTTTFLGNPLGCAAARASILEISRRALPERASTIGAAWKSALEHMAQRQPFVGVVRGRGLMLGVELVDPVSGRPSTALAQKIVAESLRRGWILLADGEAANVLSLTPPLTIDARLLDRFTELLDELLSA